MLPIGYAIRNLFRDPTRLLQAVLGSALVVLMVMVTPTDPFCFKKYIR